jgi:hypothetical protein
MTIARSEGQFTAMGQSAPVQLIGPFNVTLAGSFAGTVKLERSFDAGATWHVVSRDAAGEGAAFTQPVSLVGEEWERGVLYRLNCTAHSSGTVSYRVSQ